VDIWDSSLLLYVPGPPFHRIESLTEKRFYNVHNHRVRRLFAEDGSREIGVRLLGVIRTRDDDNPGVRYARYPPEQRFPFGGNSGVVLQDAFSSKYKSAMHSGVFETAVKKYRQKTKTQNEKKAGEGDDGGSNIPAKVRPSVIEKLSAQAQQSLENLPGQVLEQTRVFHRHIQYLVQAEPEGTVTPDLKRMLDDISRAQKLDERIKNEILQDEDARNVSGGLSITLL